MSDNESTRTILREAHDRFAAMVETMRPPLHRYCSRMTGSVLEGEDVVQETLAAAYYGLSLLRQDVPLRPWLFKIAHHKCVDFLRSRAARSIVDIDERHEPTVEIDGEIEDRDLAAHAFSAWVIALPPRERASVVLKDVLGYSLPEIAKILETTVGGVKAALHRGREKLAQWKEEAPLPREAPSKNGRAYVEAFNRRDWANLQSLLEEDIVCDLVGFVQLAGADAVEHSYLTTYAKLPYRWRMVSGSVDGESVIVCLRAQEGAWKPRHAIRLDWHGERVARIRDYAHVPYLFEEGVVETGDATSREVPK